MKMNVVLERTDTNWGAHTPDEGFCINATARTRAGVIRRFQSALAFYLDYLREQGHPAPEITDLVLHETVPLAQVRAA